MRNIANTFCGSATPDDTKSRIDIIKLNFILFIFYLLDCFFVCFNCLIDFSFSYHFAKKATPLKMFPWNFATIFRMFSFLFFFFFFFFFFENTFYLAGNYMFWRRSGVFTVNVEHISHLVLVFL